ncbi:hypothetical protein [Allopontixanthobacter sediminis]|uniref:Uncharacterized protein n=1 Tax=Allopontixanthobacter sediminis TaxID=1689985 RepID=A0A845B3P1_9SPHN|nr:hypothetical protein [Allopontixanthobacter sediminis]MXP44192.1 hypothetical protein [Allopontixanthobacter sediminis]
MTTIEAALVIGGILGFLAGLIPRAKAGCATLFVIPIVMLIYTVIELNDPSRRPDALDALYYIFNPLWPTLGALVGFGLARVISGFVKRKKPDGS